ncbi:MAG: hypothetical protein IIV80_02655 [Clostridia bacterium]|nr:hypothetical protein [Clostridia bacterium]
MSYARKAVTRMTLDMSRVDLQRSETVTLQDTNRRWEVTLTNGGTPFRLPNNWTASLVGVKPDGYGLMLSCSVVDGRIIFDFAENEQLTTCEGAFPVQFDVWDEYGELVASPKIWLHVIRDTRPYEELESLCLYSTIGDLIAAEKANRVDIDENTEDIAANAAAIAANADEIADNAERIETNADNHLQLLDRLYGEDGDVPDIRATLTEHGGQIENLMGDVADNRDGLAEVRSDLANFLDVDDHTRDQLSEVLGLIDANADAIETFKSMGGAPVGSGTLVAPKDQWSDETPTGAMVALPANTLHAGSVMLLTPANDATKEAASKARLTVSVDISGDSGGNVKDYVVLLRAETAYKPEADMEFAFVILQTTAETSLVTLIGVDAAGSPAPTSVDLSAFDPDENGKGYITETYGEGEDAPKKVTEVTYDEAGNIIKIGDTAINWGEEG